MLRLTLSFFMAVCFLVCGTPLVTQAASWQPQNMRGNAPSFIASRTVQRGVVSCSDGRRLLEVAVEVTPFVYRDDGDRDYYRESWGLWVANETAWLWGNWGAGKALARSSDAYAAGSLCGKRGDTIRINGSFAGGDMYLVYRASASRSAADQITNITIDGRSYSVGRGSDCSWDGNGVGGYDVVCNVK